MSLNSATIEFLLGKGLTGDDLLAVAQRMERRADPTATERKRRQRAKSRRDVTRDTPPIESIHTPPEVSEDKSSSPPKFVLPADIPAEPWAGFEEMRKRIKKHMTDHARSLAVAELRRLRDEEGWPPGDVLNHCTMNSYQGIYPPKDRRNARPANTAHSGLGKTSAAIASLGDFNDDRPM